MYENLWGAANVDLETKFQMLTSGKETLMM